MSRRIPYLCYNLEGHLCCNGVPLSELISQYSVESVYFLLLFQKKANPQQLAQFHQQGRDLRAQAVQEIQGKQLMYAPAMNTLQSLSACITVTYHDWDYLNQLLITYSSFFENELFFYENYDQQLWQLATKRSHLDADYGFFQKILILLALSGYNSQLSLVIKQCCEAQVPLPLLIATGIGYNSGAKQASEADQFLSFFRDTSLMTVQKKIQKYVKNKWSIPGFIIGQQPSEYDNLLEPLLDGIINSHKEYAALYETILHAESLLEKEGYSLKWLVKIMLGLVFIGVEDKMVPPVITLAQIPGWMGMHQHYLEEQL